MAAQRNALAAAAAAPRVCAPTSKLVFCQHPVRAAAEEAAAAAHCKPFRCPTPPSPPLAPSHHIPKLSHITSTLPHLPLLQRGAWRAHERRAARGAPHHLSFCMRVAHPHCKASVCNPVLSGKRIPSRLQRPCSSVKLSQAQGLKVAASSPGAPRDPDTSVNHNVSAAAGAGWCSGRSEAGQGGGRRVQRNKRQVSPVPLQHAAHASAPLICVPRCLLVSQSCLFDRTAALFHPGGCE